MRLVSIGDIGVDYYKNKGILKPGGIAFNLAISARDTGANTSLVSAIGTDSAGKSLHTLLKRLDLDISHIQHLDGNTAKQNLVLENSGERKFTGYDAGVLDKWILSADDLRFIQTHDAAFVPLSDGMEHIFEAVKNLKTHAVKVVDFSQDYEKADFDQPENIITKYTPFFNIICIGGSKKDKPLVKSIGLKYPKKAIVLTLGAEGSIGYFQKKEYIQPVIPVTHIADSTGCGDAFQGTFIVTFIQTQDMRKALKLASLKAAETLKHIGSTIYSL